MQPLQHELHRRRRHFRPRVIASQSGHRLRQAVNPLHRRRIGRRRHILPRFHRLPQVKSRYDVVQLVQVPEIAPENRQRGPLGQILHQPVAPPFAQSFQLNLAPQRGNEIGQVADPRADYAFPQPDAAPQRIADERLVVGNGHPHADPGTLVDFTAAARPRRDFRHYFPHIIRRHHAVLIRKTAPLLLHYGDFLLNGARVVRVNLRPVAVFQRRDNPPPVGVILRVGRGHHKHIQRHPHPVALNLHIPLLHQVEQPHLNPFRQVGQLVDAENPPVGPRHQPVMNGGFIGQMPPLRNLDGVDLPNQVGNGNVRRRQLFRIPRLPLQPGNGRIVPLLGHNAPPVRAERMIRIIIQLAARDNRNPLVQQVHHLPNQPRLRLPPFPQQDDVLPRQNGILQLRNHRLLKADDAGESRLLRPYLANQIAADFRPHRRRFVAAVAQLPQRGGESRSGVSVGISGHCARPCRRQNCPSGLSVQDCQFRVVSSE